MEKGQQQLVLGLGVVLPSPYDEFRPKKPHTSCVERLVGEAPGTSKVARQPASAVRADGILRPDALIGFPNSRALE